MSSEKDIKHNEGESEDEDSDIEGSSDGGSYLQEMLEGFNPTEIGNCLVKLWIVRGRKGMKGWSEGSGYVCPIMCSAFQRPCLLADGNMYEESAALEWLVKNDTSPSTGAKLQHKKVLRLGPVQEVLDIFFQRRQGGQPLSETLGDAIEVNNGNIPGTKKWRRHFDYLRRLTWQAESGRKTVANLMEKGKKLVRVRKADVLCKTGREFLRKRGYEPDDPIKSSTDRSMSDSSQIKDSSEGEGGRKDDSTDGEKSDREQREKKEKKEKKESDEAKKVKKEKIADS